MKYKQRQDCEGFEIPSGEVYRISCFDCGLVHDFVFIIQNGKPIGVAAKRNKRATAKKREVFMFPGYEPGPAAKTKETNDLVYCEFCGWKG